MFHGNQRHLISVTWRSRDLLTLVASAKDQCEEYLARVRNRGKKYTIASAHALPYLVNIVLMVTFSCCISLFTMNYIIVLFYGTYTFCRKAKKVLVDFITNPAFITTHECVYACRICNDLYWMCMVLLTYF